MSIAKYFLHIRHIGLHRHSQNLIHKKVHGKSFKNICVSLDYFKQVYRVSRFIFRIIISCVFDSLVNVYYYLFFIAGRLLIILNYFQVWDIRRKGCIFTYKGHSQGVNSVKFSPDGLWVASGGEEGLVKVIKCYFYISFLVINDQLIHILTGPLFDLNTKNALSKQFSFCYA